MFNRAIFWKTLRDSAATIVAVSIGLVWFVVLFVHSMQSMGTELMEFVSRFEFLKKIFEFGFGLDVSGEISLTVLFAVCFTHGVVLLLSWSTIIATTTRVTSGEVEKGTADILLALPVNRHEVYLSTSLVWILAALVISVCPVIGVWVGIQIFETDEVVQISRYFGPTVNFFFVLLAVGGLSSMISSFCNRRGIAIALIAGFLIASIVLNFVEPFIEPIHQFRWLGLLSYFRPVDIVRTGEWPYFEFLCLFVMAATSWTIGLVSFCRRDIPTA